MNGERTSLKTPAFVSVVKVVQANHLEFHHFSLLSQQSVVEEEDLHSRIQSNLQSNLVNADVQEKPLDSRKKVKLDSPDYLTLVVMMEVERFAQAVEIPLIGLVFEATDSNVVVQEEFRIPDTLKKVILSAVGESSRLVFSLKQEIHVAVQEKLIFLVFLAENIDWF
jgi:hypothetical protein